MTMPTHESIPRPEKLPPPTYTPAIVGVAIMLIAWGAVTTVAIVLLGIVLLVIGIWGWIAELRREH
jgi:hypothetical protein